MITTTFQFLAKLFILHPVMALIPVFILGLLYFKSKNKMVLTAIVLWLVYMVYEELHLLRIMCSGECNIRIDLLLIYPVLIVISLVALFFGIKNVTKLL
jgi:hypothetical protein